MKSRGFPPAGLFCAETCGAPSFGPRVTATVAAARAAVPKIATLNAEEANADYQHAWETMPGEQQWHKAATNFQRAIDNDSRFEPAYYSLGRARMGQHEFAKAIAAYIQCRDLFVHAGGERFSKDLDAKRRIEDRMWQYQTALSQARTTGGGAGTQTQQLYKRHELQNKLNELQQARDRSINISIDTSVPFYVSMALGAAYFRNNQFADAEREYRTALDANSGSGETHNNLAVVYLMTGRFEQAEESVKAAEKAGYKVNPNLKDDIKTALKKKQEARSRP
jgi:tetratricopeptide (TPR) repeat protein